MLAFLAPGDFAGGVALNMEVPGEVAVEEGEGIGIGKGRLLLFFFSAGLGVEKSNLLPLMGLAFTSSSGAVEVDGPQAQDFHSQL